MYYFCNIAYFSKINLNKFDNFFSHKSLSGSKPSHRYIFFKLYLVWQIFKTHLMYAIERNRSINYNSVIEQYFYLKMDTKSSLNFNKSVRIKTGENFNLTNY